VATAASSARDSRAPRALGQGSGTILVVEDDPAVRAIIARILRGDGYSVIEASRPSEARALSESNESIDLLLTDLVMPEMSGVKLSAELQATRPGLRVLFMTGYAGAALHLDETDLVSPDVPSLQKPFTSNALLDLVRTLLMPANASTRRPMP
jgi:DNA-binding NtrC family response regulator